MPLTRNRPRVWAVLGNGGATDLDDAAAGADGTSEKSFATTITLPANFFAANKACRVTAHMEYVTSGAAPTLVIRAKLGSTNLFTQNTAVAPANSVTRNMALCLMFQGTAAPGASVNVECSGPMWSVWGSSANAHMNGTAQPVAVATNGTLAVTISSQWGTATTGNTCRLRQLVVEEVSI